MMITIFGRVSSACSAGDPVRECKASAAREAAAVNKLCCIIIRINRGGKLSYQISERRVSHLPMQIASLADFD